MPSPLALDKRIKELDLIEPIRSHALELTRRYMGSDNDTLQNEDEGTIIAAIEYLAHRLEDPEIEPSEVSARHKIEPWRVMHAAVELRPACRYRALIGEWIRGEYQITEPPPQEVGSESVPQKDQEVEEGKEYEAPVTEEKSLVEKLRKMIPRQMPWTGARGTKSYYDKSQSPD